MVLKYTDFYIFLYLDSLFSSVKLLYLCIGITTLMVIFSTNLIFSLLMLSLVFFFSAILFLLLEAELIAFLIVIVYMGAIIILFLFAVMMLDYKISNLTKNNMEYVFYSYILFLIIFLFLIAEPFINSVQFICSQNSVTSPIPLLGWKSFLIYLTPLNELTLFWSKVSIITYSYFYEISHLLTNNAFVCGQALYSSSFILPFLVSGLILLLASIGSVHLGKRFINKRPKDDNAYLQQSINRQMSRQAVLFN